MRVNSLTLFLTGIIAVAIAAWGYNQYTLRRAMELDLNARYQRAFYELLTNTQNLEVLLSKSLVVNGREQAGAVFSSVWQQAMAAQANLGQLPISTELTARTAKFLTQVADYANTLVRRAGTGAPVTRDHWERLRRLYDQAAVLNRELHRMEARVATNGAYFWEITRTAAAKRGVAQVSLPQAHADFRAINREMQTYPTLIYDGPFSDHMERKKPLGLTGSVISAADAEKRALAVIDRVRGTAYSAKTTGTVKGRIEAYRVEVTGSRPGADEKATCLISRKGGHPVLMLLGRDIGGARVDLAAAEERAAHYLDRLGFPKMRLSYSIRRNGMVTFNFVGEEDGVVVYPDMVKVTVALDNGQVVGLDATPYLMAHHPRQAFRPSLTLEQARSFLSPHLKVEKGRLALIPTDAGEEKLTYEFRGTVGPNTFLIYLDAANGEEVKVLKLITSAAGTLVM
ncbi:germination protein YpeB [Thermodesulfitimonas autotrophica]|uniref:germination protein YpeB n=1 Tax=Thermodesulfitimonas autotrophica TaxID=1894989 RepID=UPI002FE41214